MTKPKARKKPRKDKRGKWSRDPWIRVLELLASIPENERTRCLKATAEFFKGRAR